MSMAAQPLTAEDPALSPWWMRTIVIVMVVGFAMLIAITMLAYRNAPPIPAHVVDAQGATLLQRRGHPRRPDGIPEVRSDGQRQHLGPRCLSRARLLGRGAASHRRGHRRRYRTAAVPAATGDADAGAAGGRPRAKPRSTLKTNRYDDASKTLHLTAPEAAAYRQQIDYWTDYFLEPARNGGLKPGLITDPTELRQFTAFVTWAAWASVANRPGETHSYTNNFPYDPSVGNTPIPDALLWSALSLIVLLAGIAAVLLAFGKFDYLGWISRGHTSTRISCRVRPARASARW